MSGTFTARVSDENLAWLEEQRASTGLSLGKIMDLILTVARGRGHTIEPAQVRESQ